MGERANEGEQQRGRERERVKEKRKTYRKHQFLVRLEMDTV